VLLDVVEQHAQRPFLIDARNGRTLTYAESHAAAYGLVEALRAAGADRGDRVALLLDNGIDLALLYLACLYAGCTAVPIGMTLAPAEREYALALAAPALVLEAAPAAEPVDAPPVQVDPSQLFTITFTSGTTSRPKGVAQTVGSMLGAAKAFADELGYGADTRMLHVLPMTYMAGILNAILCPFVAGGSIVVDRAFDAQSIVSFWRPVLEHGANTFWVAPSMLAALLRLDRDPAGPEYAQTEIRSISVGTAPLAQAVRDEFEVRYGAPLYESFGLSELLFVTTGSPRHPNPPGSPGRVLPGVEVIVGDDGELLVRTPFVMAGYLDESGRPEPPPETFRTGDLGRVDDDGNLFITGRKKDLIIRGGLNVSPQAVEDALASYPAIVRCAVLGLPHPLHGEEVVAAVELAPGEALERIQPQLVEHCRGLLAAAAVPTRFVAVESFPVGPTGKIQKAQLRTQLLAG
jgi:long-chain acyl-CoA synthetase